MLVCTFAVLSSDENAHHLPEALVLLQRVGRGAQGSEGREFALLLPLPTVFHSLYWRIPRL